MCKLKLTEDLFSPSVCLIDNVEDVNQHHLTTQQEARLDAVIGSFPSFELENLGRTSLTKRDIDVEDKKSIKQKHLSVSPSIEKLLYENNGWLLLLGVIEKSHSVCYSPVTLMVKPGKVHLFLDAHKANSVIVKSAYPVPLIEGILILNF